MNALKNRLCRTDSQDRSESSTQAESHRFTVQKSQPEPEPNGVRVNPPLGRSGTLFNNSQIADQCNSSELLDVAEVSCSLPKKLFTAIHKSKQRCNDTIGGHFAKSSAATLPDRLSDCQEGHAANTRTESSSGAYTSEYEGLSTSPSHVSDSEKDLKAREHRSAVGAVDNANLLDRGGPAVHCPHSSSVNEILTSNAFSEVVDSPNNPSVAAEEADPAVTTNAMSISESENGQIPCKEPVCASEVAFLSSVSSFAADNRDSNSSASREGTHQGAIRPEERFFGITRSQHDTTCSANELTHDESLSRDTEKSPVSCPDRRGELSKSSAEARALENDTAERKIDDAMSIAHKIAPVQKGYDAVEYQNGLGRLPLHDPVQQGKLASVGFRNTGDNGLQIREEDDSHMKVVSVQDDDHGTSHQHCMVCHHSAAESEGEHRVKLSDTPSHCAQSDDKRMRLTCMSSYRHLGDGAGNIKKLKRYHPTAEQLKFLLEVFETNQSPDVESFHGLSQRIRMPLSNLVLWFKNRRARSNKRCNESKLGRRSYVKSGIYSKKSKKSELHETEADHFEPTHRCDLSGVAAGSLSNGDDETLEHHALHDEHISCHHHHHHLHHHHMHDIGLVPDASLPQSDVANVGAIVSNVILETCEQRTDVQDSCPVSDHVAMQLRQQELPSARPQESEIKDHRYDTAEVIGDENPCSLWNTETCMARCVTFIEASIPPSRPDQVEGAKDVAKKFFSDEMQSGLTLTSAVQSLDQSLSTLDVIMDTTSSKSGSKLKSGTRVLLREFIAQIRTGKAASFVS